MLAVTSRSVALFGAAVLASLGTAATVPAQQLQHGDYHPLSERMAPGVAAGMLAQVAATDPGYLQPVRVELPSTGTVAVYSNTPEPLGSLSSPAQVAVNVGHYYRLRVADMPEFPGVEIYPSIELLDRLHPPAGREAEYPIPVILTAADLKLAMAGQMVTRIVYLEQPQRAADFDPLRRDFPQSPDPATNALQEADRLGRPLLIVRIGGRVPDGPDQPLSFFGSGGAVDFRLPDLSSEDATTRRDHRAANSLLVRTSDSRLLRSHGR